MGPARSYLSRLLTLGCCFELSSPGLANEVLLVRIRSCNEGFGNSSQSLAFLSAHEAHDKPDNDGSPKD